jgi:RimJ/RimL family protein N-acetyltransferase
MTTANQTGAAGELVIECKDIILRTYRVEDLAAIFALTWQPEIYEFLPGWNAPREQRKDWLENYEIPENRQFLRAVSEGGHVGDLRLRLGIILKETGDFIGWCCTGPKDELPPPNREIMYAISREHRGKGYTTQAAQALIQYLFENTDAEVLHALALERNLPSNRVIHKCGFDLKSMMELENERYRHFILAKSDWDQ